MGRKKLGIRETKVRIREDQIGAINRLAGPQRMSAFVRQALDHEISRLDKLQRKKKITGALVADSCRLPDIASNPAAGSPDNE